MKRPITSHMKDIVQETRSEDANARWLRRAAGELTEAEEAELVREAEADAEAALLLRATAKLDATAEDAWLDRALAARGAPASAHGDGVPALTAEQTRSTADGKTGAAKATPGEAPARRGGARIFYFVGPALAAAAALVFAVRASSPGAAALPEYAVTVEGADRAVRGPAEPSEAKARHVVSAGGRIVVRARPDDTVAATLGAKAFVLRAATGSQAAGVAPRVSPSGTVTLEGRREEIFGDATGDVDVVLVVGPPTSLPATAADALQDPVPAGSKRVRVGFTLP